MPAKNASPKTSKNPKSAASVEPLPNDIQWVKGVGPKFAPLFRKLGILTAEDMVQHYPRRYEDRRNLPPLRSLRPGMQATVRGKVAFVESVQSRGRAVPVKVVLDDGTGQVTLTWFNQPWIAKRLREYKGDVLAYGVVKLGRYGPEIAKPDYELVDEDEDSDRFASIVPVYAATEGLQQWMLRRAAAGALAKVLASIEETLPTSDRKEWDLAPIKWSVEQMHRPESDESLLKARRRIVFDELLSLQLLVQLRRAETQQTPGVSFPISKLESPTSAGLFEMEVPWAEGDTLWDEVHRMLPFDLTGAQKRVIGEIWSDMERPQLMNRLVQGDVGSGKTAVAACAMLAAIRCGYQTAIMAPTEILAEQHYLGMKRLMEPLGIRVGLMLGKQSTRERQKASDDLKSGTTQLVVGTQALIQGSTQFSKLGLVVIDEQHRFGVMQRAALRDKAVHMVDTLVMTATPIPRTLAMTVYGELDVSVIDELPPGRKPIKTHWKRASERASVYASAAKLIAEGRQAYFVCPAIQESEKLQAQAAVDLHYRLQNQVFPDLRIGLLHGQMKPIEKEHVMNQFRAHELDILVATVVIEVGVDVPNASVMVIEDANRFGLSQLHQIRGRVGRGEHQSFCILVADVSNEDAQERMEVLCDSHDGFKIAEADLRLRGPGDVLGTAQSGALDLKAADLVRDLIVLEQARSAAELIVKADPHLETLEYGRLKRKIASKRGEEAWIPIT